MYRDMIELCYEQRFSIRFLRKLLELTAAVFLLQVYVKTFLHDGVKE